MIEGMITDIFCQIVFYGKDKTLCYFLYSKNVGGPFPSSFVS
jgi:hypothetical protein